MKGFFRFYMKRCFCLIIFVLIASFLFGCTNTTAPAPDATQKPMLCLAVPIVTEEISADDGTVISKHIYQSISLTYPDAGIASSIMLDFMNRIDPEDSAAETVQQAAKLDYCGQADWNPYLYQNTYSPMRLDQNILSFFGWLVSYSGTPHPETQYRSVSYDLSTGAPLSIHDVLVENVDTALLAQKVCYILEQKADELGLYDGFEDTVRDRFEKHLSGDEDWYFTSSGMCFYFAPYALAPYASGVVCAELSYEELVGILSDACFPPENDNTSGVFYAQKFSEDNSSRFTQFSEVILDVSGEKILLYTDGTVHDIKIHSGTLSPSDDFESSAVIFAAAYLTPGDAIVLQYDAQSAVQITWRSGSETKHYIVKPEHDLFHAPVL